MGGTPKLLLHVAILASPGMGHLIPSLELAKRLVSLNPYLQVTFFITSTVGASSTTHQARLLQSVNLKSANIHVVHLPPVDPVATDSAEPMNRITPTIKLSLPSLQSVIVNSSPKPTVLIVDMFGTDAFDTAESLNMSKYLFLTTNATASAYMANVPNLTEWAEPTPPGCKPVPIECLGEVFTDRTGETHRIFVQHARKISRASGVLVNTFEDLEPQTIRALSCEMKDMPRVYPFGPLVKSSPLTPQADCLTWLDAQPADSVIYVSFGSGGTLSAEQITELAWGLELSQQRFLWVARAPDDKVASAAYFDSTNEQTELSNFLPEKFLSRTQCYGFVVQNWAPQIEILSHDSVGGFLSHCGWNSVLESIVNGVPLIACPLFAEQGLNAWMLSEDIKVAVRSTSSKGVVGRDEIARMVRLVMEGEQGKELRARAKELKKSAKISLEEGGSSYTSLSQLVDQWEAESRRIIS